MAKTNEKLMICNENYYEPPIKTDNIIKIETLTEENKKLKEQYGELLKKANILVKAYQELKTEIETLKKIKQDSVEEVFSNVGKSSRNIVDKIILWFNT